MNQLIAPAIAIQFFDSFAFQAKYFSALRTWVERNPCFTINGGHFYVCSDRCIYEVNVQIEYDIITIAFQISILFFDHDQQIARYATSWRYVPFASYR